MLYVLAIAVIVILVGLVAIWASGRRGSSLSDVDRFHKARTITTGWSQQGPSRPVPVVADTVTDKDDRGD
ncbi:MAG TPA: hypothetical protein VHC41_00940 [Mycobacteriales bacterium]|nr:hypothetical protein [Mycobacteriales bacterium]